MDINDIRKIFGEMPIENLNSAQLLQKKKNRQILIGLLALGCFALGAFAMHKYKEYSEDREK